jgi:hypothetical protein
VTALRTLSSLILASSLVVGQQPPSDFTVSLRVDTGTPLRVYITHRVSYRIDAPVSAILIDPVWSFDRIVLPAGTVIEGHIAGVKPVTGMVRFRAIFGGDFTPLKVARVSFTHLTLPDSRQFDIQTDASIGLGSYYIPPKPKKKKDQTAGQEKRPNWLTRTVSGQMNDQQSGDGLDLVRGPNKVETLEDILLSKLPYHPQWYRSRMRFDATLTSGLALGEVRLRHNDLTSLGITPPSDAIAQIRITQTLSSGDAHTGDPIRGTLSQPMFDSRQRLTLPEGTQVSGKVTLVQHARLWHRSGKLRFAITSLDLPPAVAAYLARPSPSTSVRAQLSGVERTGIAVKVDSEGTAKATESKTRLFRPVIAGLIAARSMDNDADKGGARGGSNSGGANNSGRGAGGFSGFGVLGIAASRGPQPIGEALAFYGLAWAVYSNVIARGREVAFQKNSESTIRFGASERPK